MRELVCGTVRGVNSGTRVRDMAPKRVLFAVVRQKLARLGFGSVHELADAWEADVRGAEFSPEELEVFRFVVS